MAIVVCAGGVASAAMTDDLVAYYSFDGDMLDTSFSANVHNGTYSSTGASPVYTVAKFGQGIDLPGGSAESKVVLDDTPDFHFQATHGGNVSFSAWYRVDAFDQSWQALIVKGEGDAFRIHRRGGDQRFNWNAGGGGDLDQPYNTGVGSTPEYHHMVTTRNAAGLKEIWIDGVLRNSVVNTGAIDDRLGRSMMIGANPDDGGGKRWFNGVVDDVAFWGRALTAAEIGQIWNGGAGMPISAFQAPIVHEVGGDNTIGTETLEGTQSNGVFGGAATGRFVQVMNNGTGSRRMDIGEVEVFAPGVIPAVDNAADSGALNPTTDLATLANGAVVHSQTTNQPHGTNTTQVIDGTENTGAMWSTDGVGNFVLIDLGSTSDIGTVRVHQRNDGCCQDRLQDFSVTVFADDGAGNPGASSGSGSYPGQPADNGFGELSLAGLVSADLTAQLQPWDSGLGYTYVFELSSNDQIAVDNPDPGIFTTILDINNADIVVEALGPLPAGEVFQLLSADEIIGQYHSLTLPPGVFEFGNFNETGAVTTQVIPEPITMLAIGLSLTGLGGYIRRRRRA